MALALTPKDLLEKARHCILQNFEQVQKKRGVGLIKNKHWRAQRASERSERARERSVVIIIINIDNNNNNKTKNNNNEKNNNSKN